MFKKIFSFPVVIRVKIGKFTEIQFCFQINPWLQFAKKKSFSQQFPGKMDFATGGIAAGGFYGAGMAGGRFDRKF